MTATLFEVSNDVGGSRRLPTPRPQLRARTGRPLLSREHGGVFGQRLHEARQRAGLGVSQLANRCNLNAAAISMFERGKRNPTLEVLNRLATELSVSIDWLTGREERAA